MTARIVLNVTVPNAAWGANRFAVRSADGAWFMAWQDGVVGKVSRVANGTVSDIPLPNPPTMRPTLYADPSGLYVIGGYDGNAKQVVIWYVDDYKTVYTSAAPDARVDALQASYAALQAEYQNQQQRLVAIEAALGTIGGGAGLDPRDRAALDWVQAVRAVLGLS